MTRAAFVLVALSALVDGGCDVGSVPAVGGGGGTGADGGSGSGSGSSMFQPGVAVARSTTPTPAHVHAANASTNAGQDCQTCHSAGGAAGIEFSVSGTLYGSDGVTADPGGAWVTIQSGGAGALTGIMTDTAGNFYWGPGEGEPALTLPAVTAVTASPTIDPMSEQAATGGCSSSLCHALGSTQGVVKLM